MPLISCPACDRQVSAQAESCPQCGHPIGAAPPAPTGPTCYACSTPATTRCPKCGALSCARHLQNVSVSHISPTEHGLVLSGQSYELRCDRCLSTEAEERKKVDKVLNRFLVGFFITMVVVSVIVAVIVMVGGLLPARG
jgi:hypothetical protein